MIVVTGGNGQLGRRVVEHLLARRGSTAVIGVSVRDTAKAADLAARGISVRQGNFDLPESLPQAFEGASRLVLISTDGPREQRIAQHRNAIAAAKAAGVGHILYTGILDVSADSPAEFAAVHRATEADLEASGLKVTILRNPLYGELLPTAVAPGLESGTFYLPAGEGRTSFVSRDELAQALAAAAAAPALAKDIYELTGQATHGFHEVAAAVAKVTGKALRYQAVGEDDYAQALTQHGLPAWLARAVANMFSAVGVGKFDRTTNDFAALVGHPPRPLACLVQEMFGSR